MLNTPGLSLEYFFMANWIRRKTTKGPSGVRFTTTTSYGKNGGITNSQSVGNKNGRTTVSKSSNGRTKMTQTYHMGDMSMRKTVFSSSNKIKNKKIRTKKLTKAETEAIVSLFSSKYFWSFIIVGIVFLLIMK